MHEKLVSSCSPIEAVSHKLRCLHKLFTIHDHHIFEGWDGRVRIYKWKGTEATAYDLQVRMLNTLYAPA